MAPGNQSEALLQRACLCRDEMKGCCCLCLDKMKGRWSCGMAALDAGSRRGFI